MRLRQLRRQANYTQGDLAKLLSVSRSTISMWECDVRIPDYEMLVKLCSIFHVTLSELLEVPQETKEKIKIPIFSLISREYSLFETTGDYEVIYEEIDKVMAQSGTHFAVRIKENSMEPNIQNGDLVIIREEQVIESDTLVLVTVGNCCATVRKVKSGLNGIVLIPFNPDFEIQCFTVEEMLQKQVNTIGKVVELRRKF